MAASVRRRGSIPESLFAENQGIVGHVLSTQFSRLSPEDREESESWGRIGLWSAANKFDAMRGFAFSTYAVSTVRGYILRGLTRDKGKNPSSCLSLDAPVAGGSERVSLADFLPDPESGMDAALDRAGFGALVAGLPPRERLLVTALYAEQRTLQEIAAGLGLTRQRVYQLHSRALRRLRQMLPPPE